MPLDENFPTYLYALPDPKAQPTVTNINFTVSGSTPHHEYTLTRALEPANTYSVALTDAHFPSITYGSLDCALTFSPSSNNDAPQVHRPNVFTLQLFAPDSAVTITHKQTTMRVNYWEFTLPRDSFPPPTNSALDATYTPPIDEHLTFRWRKEGGMLTRSQLRCSLVSTGKGEDPDTALAMYSGVGDKNGRGELVVYESNFRRVDMQDLKGLEMVMLLSARVINDVWFLQPGTIFNAPLVGATGRQRAHTASAPPPPATAEPIKPAAAPRAATTNGNITDGGGTFAQRFQRQQKYEEKQLHEKRPQEVYQEEKIVSSTEEIKKQQRIAEEQATIHKMLADEEWERARKQAAIDAETERLRRLYEQEALSQHRPPQQLQQQQQRRPQQQQKPVDPRMKPQRLTYKPPPPRIVQPQKLNYVPRPQAQQQRPPVVGGGGGWVGGSATSPVGGGGSGWLSGGGSNGHARQSSHGNFSPGGNGLMVPDDQGKRLDEKSRRRSFLGFNWGGGSDEPTPPKEKEKVKEKVKVKEKKKGKLTKKTSSMW